MSFRAGPGDLLALLGANGAGKSSVLRAISGLVPYGGAVTFDGRPLRGRSVQAIARRGLLQVPEGRRIFPTLSVRENLDVTRPARARRPPIFTRDEVFELFPPLRPLADRGGWALSGGEQQMLAVGRALMAAPRCLLLDEPSLGLAPLIASTVFSALEEIRVRVPVVVVEQNTELALRICTTAHVLAGGAIVMSGPSTSLRESEELLNRYLGHHDIDPVGS